MNWEFFYGLYQHEWSRKDQLASSLGIHLGLITAIGGGLAYLGRAFPYSDSSSQSAFLVLGSISACSLILAGYFLIRSYHGYTYKGLPNSQHLVEHIQDLEERHKEFPDSTNVPIVDFEEGLILELAHETDINAANNVLKAAFLHRAVSAIVVSLVFGLAASLPAGMAVLNPGMDREPDHSNQPTSLMTEDKSKSDAQGDSTPKAEPPPKPAFPTGKNFRENDTSGGK